MEMYQILILIAGGFFSVVVGISTLLFKMTLIRSGGRTTATVVRTERRKMRNGWTHIPILRYMVNGREYIAEYHGSINPKYEDGEILEVMYHKNNPNKMIVEGDKLQYVGSILFMLIGLVMFGIGFSQLL